MLGAPAAGGGIVAVQVQELFGAVRLLGPFLKTLGRTTIITMTRTGVLPAPPRPLLRALGVWSCFRHGAGRQQAHAGALGAQRGHTAVLGLTSGAVGAGRRGWAGPVLRAMPVLGRISPSAVGWTLGRTLGVWLWVVMLPLELRRRVHVGVGLGLA